MKSLTIIDKNIDGNLSKQVQNKKVAIIHSHGTLVLPSEGKTTHHARCGLVCFGSPGIARHGSTQSKAGHGRGQGALQHDLPVQEATGHRDTWDMGHWIWPADQSLEPLV